MVKKEFTFRGKTTSEVQSLGETEMLKLLTSRVRRTIKRGYNVSAQLAISKLKENGTVKTHSREIVITPDMIGKVISIHKGNGYFDLTVTEEMMGHRFGEFALVTKKVVHGKAGLGATGGSKTETRK